MRTLFSPLYNWIRVLPIQDPVERRLAALVQVMLLGFMAILLLALAVNLILAPELSLASMLTRTAIFLLVIGIPLMVLRRGYFRTAVLLLIALFMGLETLAIAATSLRQTAETLLFFTLAFILAGMLLGRRALVITFLLGAGITLFSALRETDPAIKLDSLTVAGNFILLNGLIGAFLDQFRFTLRTALTSALERETELEREVMERQRVEQNLSRRVSELEALYQTGIAFSQTFRQKEIAEKVIEVLRVHLDWHHAAVRVRQASTDNLELLAFSQSDHSQDMEAHVRSSITEVGHGMVGWVVAHGKALRLENVNQDPRYIETFPGMHSGLYVPLQIYNRTIGCISVESEHPQAFTQEDENLLTTLAVQAAVAIENARLFENARQELAERKRVEQELRQREAEYRSLAENIPDVVALFDSHLRHVYVNNSVEKVTGVPAHVFIGKVNQEVHPQENLVTMWNHNLHSVFESGESKTIEFEYDSVSGLRLFESRLVPERDAAGKVERVLSIARDITERRQSELQIRQQLERLMALSRIDQAIISSFDLNVTLDILLSQVVSQLSVDAADILLLRADGRVLEYAAGLGFRTRKSEAAQVRVGESYAGRVINERRMLKIDGFTTQPERQLLTQILAGEEFDFYCGVPLVAKGKAIGVLEVFSRTPLRAYPEWLDYLNTLAGQAAIAIENATLFDHLEQSNRELIQAYDATIEGWSRAMDLRDKETEGHTQRVTRMTLELARVMQVDESRMTHIRRGALLHDIGELGIPDHILLKAEALSDEEWETMRRHPQFALEMLSSIRYLEPALKIPYCHHERWDGRGYPRGLRGEQIPLEARIFSVVDVWDALRSDRPYRPAWSVEAARHYIREQAGSAFDPEVVAQFLKMVS